MDAQLQPLSSFCHSIDYGLTASASTTTAGPKFLRITDIVGQGIDWDSVPSVNCTAAEARKYRLHHGDVVIARTGATTGYSAYISNPPEAVFASYLVRLRVSDENDPRYVAYALRSSYFWDWIRSVMDEKAAQPNASASTMAKALLPRPARSTQAEIARILGQLDDKIEMNRKMCATLEEMARAIFRSWFVDFDPVWAKAAAIAEGCDPERAAMAAISGKREEDLDTLPPDTLASLRATAALFPDRFTDSELGDVPAGWCTRSLKAIAPLSTASVNPLSHPAIPYKHFSIPAYDAGRMPFDELGRTIKSNKYQVRQNTVLVSKLNPNTPRVWLPQDVTDHAICSTEFMQFSPQKPEMARYVYLYMLMPEMQDQILQRATGSTGSRQRAQPTQIEAIQLVLPPNDIIDSADAMFRPLLERESAARKESLILAALRDTLLPKLLSGELRIPEAEEVTA